MDGLRSLAGGIEEELLAQRRRALRSLGVVPLLPRSRYLSRSLARSLARAASLALSRSLSVSIYSSLSLPPDA